MKMTLETVPKISFVIATKDRPDELCRALQSIRHQSRRPDEIIIVDGGSVSIEDVINKFLELNIIYLKSTPPSASRQRNLGIHKVGSSIDLVGILDDDIVFETNAIEKMVSFWEQASSNLGGAAFNLVNHPGLSLGILKRLPFSKTLELYSSEPGVVLKSGFQTMIGYLNKNQFVKWLPSTACVYRKQVFRETCFDEWFSDYSYLEDLDISYTVGKKYLLAVVADANYYHLPATSSRLKAMEFGKREVKNRLYFVKKNKELSLAHCYLDLSLRLLMNLGLSVTSRRLYFAKRAWGNVLGLIASLDAR